MAKEDWLTDALVSLDFFANNPEYYQEFKHEYFTERFGVSRQTLYRSDKYMERYREVKDILKETSKPVASRTTGLDALKEKVEQQKQVIAEKNEQLSELKLRLNDCYQMLEDHGIDPEFLYPKRRKKHKQA